jgi:hypothetical protein
MATAAAATTKAAAAPAKKDEQQRVWGTEVDVHNPRSHRADYYASGTCVCTARSDNDIISRISRID